MRTIRLRGGTSFDAILEVFVALDRVARTSPRFRELIPALVEEIAEEWRGSLPLLIEHAASYVERSQRVTDRFESWRGSKRGNRHPNQVPFRHIGEPDRPLRRVRGDEYARAMIATVVVVRAKDREDGKARSPRFIAMLAQAYEGWSNGVIAVLLAHAIRDRRVARRFRSWRRAMAARAASPPSSPASRSRLRGQQGVR